MLENLQGIGPKTINMLNNMGIYSIKDLLYYFPYRYDILKRSDISNLSSRDKVVTSGVIDGQPTMIFITESFKKIIFRINTGSGILNITIYNKNNLYKELSLGKVVTIIGVYDRSKNTVIASNVRFEELPVSPKIDPVYRTHNVMTKKGFVKILKSGIDWAYNNNNISVDNEVSRAMQGSLPDFIIDKYNFLSTLKAISEVHFPSDITMLKRARKRLKYEELFNYLLKNKYAAKRIREGKKFIKRKDISKDIYAFIEKNSLNFSASQKACIKDIFDDFAKNSRMYRMIMGNKYSGKFDCMMMGCFYNYLSGHKSIILTNSDKDSEYVYERINDLSKLMGIKLGIIEKKNNGNEVIAVGNEEINVDGNVGACDVDLFGELREEDISKKDGLSNDDNACVKNDNYKSGDDKDTGEDLFGDYDVVICNGNIDFGDMSKSDMGLCIIYNGDRTLNNFKLIKIFMDSKTDILCVSDFAISEKRDALLYEGMDISRVLMSNGSQSVSVKTKIYKRKDREMVFENIDTCLERGCSAIVVTSKSGSDEDDSWLGDSEEIGDDVKPFIDDLNERFCDEDILMVCDEGGKEEVLDVFERFRRGDASILCLDSEQFDLVDGMDIVNDVLYNKIVGTVIIDGGEEFSLSRLDNYRCMMQGYVSNSVNICDTKMEINNDANSVNGIADENGKRYINFDIIVNDSERDMRILEEQVSGFVISDYDFMYKGSERFDWFKRGDGGMFICNVKKDFNMMGRVKDDADKYFELFLDNLGWFEKVVRG